MKVTCPWCGSKVRARVPKGGDGSGVMPYKHPAEDGSTCTGSYRVLDAAEAADAT